MQQLSTCRFGMLVLPLIAGMALAGQQQASPPTFQTIAFTEFSATIQATVPDARAFLLDDDADVFAPPTGLLWAMPRGTRDVTVTLENFTARAPRAEELDALDAASPEAAPVAVSDVMIMRGIPVAAIAINPVQEDANGNPVVYENLQFRLEYSHGGSTTPSRPLPAALYEAMRGVIHNLDEVAGEPNRLPEPYLIITAPGYLGGALDQFALWKQQRGHEVTIVTTDETGTSDFEIRNYLRDLYETEEYPPVFLLLIGDVDGTNAMPGWYVQGYFTSPIISDHLYTMLEGDDYLPEMLVGRLSVDTQFELQTVVNKIIGYEREPFEPHGAWRTHMSIVGVRSTPTQFITYNSAWPTLRWVAQEFMNSGYTQIDSVPYPGSNASQVNAVINNGVSFLSYRGYGSPSNWSFPNYTLSDINAVANGERLPVITSIVCGGGAFASDTDPCFGELWLRKGTPAQPAGAVGFIGPSELDTKTRWNNTNTAGIYQGILHEGVNTLGGAMLRGKLELMRQFPNNANVDEPNSNTSVPFYFRCFNLLGDPGLNFFVGEAQELDYSLLNSPVRGDASVTIYVSQDGTPLADVSASVSYEGFSGTTVYSSALSNSQGLISLPLPQNDVEQTSIALTKPRFAPQIFELTLPTVATGLGAQQMEIVDDGTLGSSGNGDGIANPGERLALSLTLGNTGMTAAYPGGSLSLSASDNSITVMTPSSAIGTIIGEETLNAVFLVVIDSSISGSHSAVLNWHETNELGSWSSAIEIAAPAIAINAILTAGMPLNPEPGVSSSIEFEIVNNGMATLAASNATLISLDERIEVLGGSSDYAALVSGAVAIPLSGAFTVDIAEMYPGERIPMRLTLTGGSVRQEVDFDLITGNLDSGDPTAPDAYGYRAFDHLDVDYPEAPDYAWIEIDPNYGGQGSQLSLTDHGEGYDQTVTVALPFPFQFYGEIYTQLSICTNGWASFGDTDESYFRNYSIPAIASADKMVCVFWDDLITAEGRVCTLYDTTAGRYIVEWSRMENAYGVNPQETFQLVLYDEACWPTLTGDGDIQFNYNAISNVDSWDNFATIGIQDREHNYALPLEYAAQGVPGLAPLRSNTTYKLTTGRLEEGAYAVFAGNVIDDDDEGASNGNGDGIPQNGETLELQFVLENVGTETMPPLEGFARLVDPYIQLLNGAVTFGAIDPGMTGTSTPVTAVIEASTPDGHYANFTLALGEGTSPCAALPALSVSGPVLFVTELLADDDNTGSSSGNDNGEINPGETIELFPTINNSGQNDALGVTARLFRLIDNVSIHSGVIEFGDVASGETIESENAFTIGVSQLSNNAMPLKFEVRLEDDYGTTWSETFEFVVAEVRLQYSSLRVLDPAPGGNNNGHAEPGETVEAYITLRNRGLGTAQDVVIELFSVSPGLMVDPLLLAAGNVSGNAIREIGTPFVVQLDPELSEPAVARMNGQVRASGGITIDQEFSFIVGEAELFEDFEATGSDGWSIYGTGLWHRQARETASPTRAYYCGLEGTHQYPAQADAYLRSPRFFFDGTGMLIVSTRYDIPDQGDHARIDLEIGPARYRMLADLNGHAEWHQLSMSLDGLPPAEDARLRFWFASNFSIQGEGWYVDDVLLLDESTPVTDERGAIIPEKAELHQNYPNPFNDQTVFTYAIPKRDHVRLSLYNVEGRKIADLVDDVMEAGVYELGWQPISLASGLYFLRLETGGTLQTRKIAYLK